MHPVAPSPLPVPGRQRATFGSSAIPYNSRTRAFPTVASAVLLAAPVELPCSTLSASPHAARDSMEQATRVAMRRLVKLSPDQEVVRHGEGSAPYRHVDHLIGLRLRHQLRVLVMRSV